MRYKLIALDLDGTLLRDDLTMSPRVRRSIEAARERGAQIILASGRGYPSMRPWAEVLGITTPLICYQGAVVVDPLTQQRIYERTFPMVWVAELRDFARARALSLTLYVRDEIYVEHKRHDDAFYAQWFGLPYHVVDDVVVALPLAPDKFIIVDEEEVLDRVRPEVEAQFGARLQIVRSHRYFLEGLAWGANKGSALAWLAGRLGVTQAETMAIGDAGNDRSMIAWAGLGVAMGNASAEAKEVADYIAPSVEQDGVAEAIERFCLNGSHSLADDRHRPRLCARANMCSKER